MPGAGVGADKANCIHGVGITPIGISKVPVPENAVAPFGNVVVAASVGMFTSRANVVPSTEPEMINAEDMPGVEH